jgi:DNA mismatch repair protein MutS
MQDIVQQSATPLMKQYYAIKQQYPDTLVLFQVGDFYELFFDDAKKAAAALGITLTSRGKNNGEDIPLCGVPVHALDYYMVKLVKAGFRIALCNQLEEAVPGKVVQRGVVQVFTPGTLTDDALLNQKSASYLCVFVPLAHEWGLLFGELLTAQLYATVLVQDQQKSLEGELGRFYPDEVIVPESMGTTFIPYFKKLGYCTTSIQTKEAASVDAWLQGQFKQESLTPCSHHESLREAFAIFYAYLQKNQAGALEQFKQLHFYRPEEYVILDAATQRNLELIKNSHDGSSAHTLFSVLDNAITPMGSRMIKKWLMRPLIKEELIIQRHDVLELFVRNIQIMNQVESLLKQIGDIERVVGRIALGRASLHDYLLLKSTLKVLPSLFDFMQAYDSVPLLRILLASNYDFSPLHSLLQAALNDDSSKDWLINSGFDKRLDQMRSIVEKSNNLLLDLEKEEQQKTNINSLKIRYNQVHGYYIEVTKANLHLVPDHYSRHQTLVGKERFTTAELKRLEHEIQSARTQIEKVEAEVFDRIKHEVFLHVSQLRKTAQSLAYIDGLFGFARTAYTHNYVRPYFNGEHAIDIKQGRHPVVEQKLSNKFIPNDTVMNVCQKLWILTGPNMGGKSTYLRQVALISLMAQCGSFVPALSASLPLLDRIFTRIGASDNLAYGKSTFLVEMEETALICAQATSASLVILDEVGRGTSTFDGLALAQAVVEYIHTTIKSYCFFATHYHELTALEKHHAGIVNYYAESKKTKEGILLLHTIARGIADGSFGIEVAKVAQLPSPIIARAREILDELSAHSIQPSYEVVPATPIDTSSLAQKVKQQDELVKRLYAIDYNNLSPKQAFDILWSIKDAVDKQ